MQLVIDIPGEIRKSIFDGVYCGILDDRVYKAIKNGVPLPEGHRGIVDLKEVQWAFDDAILAEAQRTGKVRASHNEIASILKSIPLLLEADQKGG